MTIYLYAACTNSTGLTLNFEAGNAVHGTMPVADPTPVNSGFFSAVTASPIDVAFGPSPEGSFTWALPGQSGQFTFAYNLHSTPVTLSATQTPVGYVVPVCTIDEDGNAKIEMSTAG